MDILESLKTAKEISRRYGTARMLHVDIEDAIAEIERLRAAAAGAGAGAEWQPIETAPKDGTDVDLWGSLNKEPRHRITDCHWHKGEWLVWGASGVDDEPHWMPVFCASHWMPLPPAPAGAVSGAAGTERPKTADISNSL